MRLIRETLSRLLFWVAISGGLAIVLLYALSWQIQAAIGELLFAVVAFVLLLTIAATTVLYTMVYFIVYRRQWVAAVIPLVVNTTLVTIVLVGQGVNAKARIDFRLNFQARQEVVAMTLAGQLPMRDGLHHRLAALPSGYQALSRPTGSVMVYERGGATHVVFLATHGLFQSFTGWVYRSDGEAPQLYERALHGDRFGHIRPLAPNWYWVEYYD